MVRWALALCWAVGFLADRHYTDQQAKGTSLASSCEAEAELGEGQDRLVGKFASGEAKKEKLWDLARSNL